MDTVVPPLVFADEGFTLDISHSGVYASALDGLRGKLLAARAELVRQAEGAAATPGEPSPVTFVRDRRSYERTPVYADLLDFFERLRRGKFSGANGRPFAFVVFNGIGDAVLGPQLLHHAMHGAHWNEKDKFERDNYPRVYFLDNTDPAGLHDLLEVVDLERTLVVNLSRARQAQESRNNLEQLTQCYAEHDLDFSKHACAITEENSDLDRLAHEARWLRVWLLPDNLGPRHAITSVTGHAAAACTGIDFAHFLAGARAMDDWALREEPAENPVLLLAAAWYLLGNGRGERAMVMAPYSDRLAYLPRYLQMLVMESLGKAKTRAGQAARQGLVVYGNKGSTDGHALVQQLQEGPDDFFVTFIEFLADQAQYTVADNLTMGDHLHALLGGLMLSLYARDRRVLSITCNRLNARTLGMIVALYERAVAAYAELIDVHAYNQPGVAAYKRIGRNVNEINHTLQHFIGASEGFAGSAADFARAVNLDDWEEEVEGMLAKFALNERRFGRMKVTRSLVGRRWRYQLDR